MLSIWSEFLPFDALRHPDTISLLLTGDLHPLIAVRPGDDLGELGQTIRTLQSVGRNVGIWPLLSEEQGYWPNERNLTDYAPHVAWILQGLGRVRPNRCAVDLEPPYAQVQHIMGQRRSLRTLWRMLQDNVDPQAHARNCRDWEAWARGMRAQGVNTLAVALPLVAYDLRDEEPLWQDVLKAPWHGVEWGHVGVMAYGSMVTGMSRGWLGEQDVRAVHFSMIKDVARAYKERAHVAIGLTGTGKFGDEPVYQEVDGLLKDLGAAYAAGIFDVSIFCLEGLLGRSDGGAWAHALGEARALVPRKTWPAWGVEGGLRGMRWVWRMLGSEIASMVSP